MFGQVFPFGRQQVAAAEGAADGEVHTAFVADDACHHALRVLVQGLLVATVTAEIEFVSLHQVAGVPFVTDADRNDMQVDKGLQWGLFSAEGEHLDNGRGG